MRLRENKIIGGKDVKGLRGWSGYRSSGGVISGRGRGSDGSPSRRHCYWEEGDKGSSVGSSNVSPSGSSSLTLVVK